MKINAFFPAFLIAACSLFSSCSLVKSGASSDVNSSNPTIAAQAQKVQDLERQVKEQKTISETEKDKLEGLELQLKGAKQNLKGLKTQAKAG